MGEIKCSLPVAITWHFDLLLPFQKILKIAEKLADKNIQGLIL